MKAGLLDMYKYLPVVALILGLFVVFFADDKYRYVCQDPTNWDTPECQPPMCTASGTCPENLVTLDGSPVSAEQLAEMVAEIEASQAAVGIKPAEVVIEEEKPLYEEVE